MLQSARSYGARLMIPTRRHFRVRCTLRGSSLPASHRGTSSVEFRQGSGGCGLMEKMTLIDRDPKRAAGLAARFHESVGRAPEGVWKAPGRVNLIGEHTD